MIHISDLVTQSLLELKEKEGGFDFFRNFEIVLNYAVSEKIDLVIHGGNLFFRNKIPPLIVSKVYSSLLNFA